MSFVSEKKILKESDWPTKTYDRPQIVFMRRLWTLLDE